MLSWLRAVSRGTWSWWKWVVLGLTASMVSTLWGLRVGALYFFALASLATWSMAREAKFTYLVSEALLPSLLLFPDGLENRAVASLFFHALTKEVRGGSVQQRVQLAASSILGSSEFEISSDCRGGHSPVCSHRVGANTMAFWQAVAAVK